MRGVYLFIAAAVCVLSSHLALAQTASGLSGTVTDQAGATVSNVTVKIKNLDTGAIRRIATDASGRYQASGLPAGRVEIRAAKSDYAEEIRTGITLSAGQTTTVDIKMRRTAPEACGSVHDFYTTDCTLTWHGITAYGAYDAGFGWVSHGLPNNGYNYEGESLVNRNAAGSRFLLTPNNLQQTGLGIKGKEEFLPGWSVVFNFSTGINPQSGLLANASGTQTANNGLPRGAYSYVIDGARAGQPFNDEFYGGVSSEHFGTLTFGRQRSLGTDAMLLYDPASGGYAFSYIGYNGTMAGGGDTEDSRWDYAFKYRFTYGPAHFGAMYKMANGSGGCYSAASTWTATTCTPESAHNNAYGFDVGANLGKFSFDIVPQHYNDAVSVLNPLLGPQSLTAPYQSTTNSINTNPISGGVNLIDPNNTVYGIVTDNYGIIAAAKYKWDPFKFYAGYEYIWQNNPKNPMGVGATAQGSYFMSGVEDNNLDSEKLVNIWWTGGKYTMAKKTDFTIAWYQQRQNTFRVPPTCVPGNMRASCAGTLNEGSFYADHRFTPRFDAYTGLAYSYVTGGLAIAIPHGPGVPYLHNSNWAPNIGARFAF
jgi:predicted porin